MNSSEFRIRDDFFDAFFCGERKDMLLIIWAERFFASLVVGKKSKDIPTWMSRVIKPGNQVSHR